MNSLILLVLLPVLSMTSWSNEFNNTVEVGDVLATVAVEEVIDLEASLICDIYGFSDEYEFDNVYLSYNKTKDWDSRTKVRVNNQKIDEFFEMLLTTKCSKSTVHDVATTDNWTDYLISFRAKNSDVHSRVHINVGDSYLLISSFKVGDFIVKHTISNEDYNKLLELLDQAAEGTDSL